MDIDASTELTIDVVQAVVQTWAGRRRSRYVVVGGYGCWRLLVSDGVSMGGTWDEVLMMAKGVNGGQTNVVCWTCDGMLLIANVVSMGRTSARLLGMRRRKWMKPIPVGLTVGWMMRVYLGMCSNASVGRRELADVLLLGKCLTMGMRIEVERVVKGGLRRTPRWIWLMWRDGLWPELLLESLRKGAAASSKLWLGRLRVKRAGLVILLRTGRQTLANKVRLSERCIEVNVEIEMMLVWIDVKVGRLKILGKCVGARMGGNVWERCVQSREESSIVHDVLAGVGNVILCVS